MIAKCHTTEIQNEISNIIENAQWSIRLHDSDQFWFRKLVEIYDAVWTLFVIDAISQKTFDALTEPIQDFEWNNDIRLICRFNVPTRV